MSGFNRVFLIAASVALSSLGVTSQATAQETGIWRDGITPNLWITLPVVVANQDRLGMLTAAPGTPGPDWEAWVGIPAGTNAWDLRPLNMGANTNLMARWTVGGDGTAQMQVQSCSLDCGPFTAGRTIYFEQILAGQEGGSVPVPGDVKPGTYSADTSAFEACLHVSADGSSLTSSGSGCDNNNSLDIDMQDGTSSFGGDCNANVHITEPVQIINNSFTKYVTVSNVYFQGSFTVKGTFSGNTVSGTFSGQGTYIPGVCSGNWNASL